MGPIALFDKSFLQSLSLNESLFFDHFFLSVICPLFYVETLADLEKAVRQGRTPEQEVGTIASKTPELHGALCASHLQICASSLLGNEMPMDGRVPRAGGRHVNVHGKKGIVYEPSPEEEAFSRWQQGDFLQVERRFAKTWRHNLKSADPSGIADALIAMGINPRACKTLEQAKRAAESFVQSCEAPRDRMNLACIVLGLPTRLEEKIYDRWRMAGHPVLTGYSPYAAFAAPVALFFHIALGASLLSRADQMDISYLYYLPFCMIFTSSDRLHETTAPLFLRPDQAFVWGRDLKTDLKHIVEHYLSVPEVEREQGIFRLAPSPPRDSLVASLWKRHLGREKVERPEIDLDAPSNKDLVNAVRMITEAPAIPTDEVASQEEISSVAIERYIRKRRGSFYQVPKDED